MASSTTTGSHIEAASNNLWLVIDAESVGLHGEAFAIGFLVINDRGHCLDRGTYACDPHAASGMRGDLRWVMEHVPLDNLEMNCADPREVRDQFWRTWITWRAQGAKMVVDCGWPVEANMLSACLRDAPDRKWEGPYPLLEMASLLDALGEDPTEALPRELDEMPMHHPEFDARQSARIWLNRRSRIVAAMRSTDQ